MTKTKILIFVAFSTLLMAGQCSRPADVASYNLSMAADNFEVARRITFYNGITDKVVLVVEGYCSLGNHDPSNELSVTCKLADGNFVKDYLGLSDNVFYVVEQLSSVNVSEFHYRVLFRPQSLIPDVDFQGSMDELTHNRNNDG